MEKALEHHEPGTKPARWPNVAICFVFLVLSTSFAFGQANQGAIEGNIQDPSGALVPKATVTAIDEASGTKYESTSSSAGTYVLSNLRTGTYDISVNAPGFSLAQVNGVVVQVGTTSSLNIALRTGSLNQTVTVSGDSPTVETQTSDVGSVVTSKQVLDLPMALGSTVQSMRSPEAFVFLTPGTVGPGTNGGGSNGATTGGPFESKITGGQNYGTEILLDGEACTGQRMVLHSTRPRLP